MNIGVGYTCPTCKKVLFGLAEAQGVRVLYSNCTCGGECHLRTISLAIAETQLDDLIESEKPAVVSTAIH